VPSKTQLSAHGLTSLDPAA
jgi:hypothetical protein